MMVVVALFADLIGHWYMGTHLLSAVLISFLTAPLVSFYRMICSPLQKITLTSAIYLIALIMIKLVELLTGVALFNWSSFILNTVVICPLVVWVLNLFVFKPSSDVMY